MIAFDTNVLIYATNRHDARRQKTAVELISGTRDAVLLWQVACEFVAASRKLAPFGRTTEETWRYLDEYAATMPLVLPGPGVLARARTLHVEQQWSFWDAMIVAACLEAGTSRLYSEDLPGRAAPEGLEVVNPFA